MAHLYVQAGPIHWGGIRAMAASLGLKCEESRGWLSRSFVLRGDIAALKQASDHIEEFIKEKEAKK